MSEENLKWYIETGDVNGFERAISKFNDVNQDIGNGRRLIHIAADYGQSEIIEILIKKGADVNAKDGFGMTPLIAAVYEDHPKCVAVLLKYKAVITSDPKGKNLCDCTDSQEIKSMLSK
ncbi:unnamed protein product [Rodentolepis nana]|uniref:ANK_REP_REGION domain-containing protein n=1 Tax=Rodentolepis nana TaxID=102285 RepID=A0A0R3TDP1_RODNA|nr:unnamed protein product [Rodentolepis nana]